MSKSTPLMILAAAALFSGVAGAATRTPPAAKPAMATTAKPAAKVAKPIAVKPMVAPKPVAMAPKPAAPAPKMAAAKPAMKMAAAKPASGRMVQAKLANGKTVTYNCSLAGNASKKACHS